MSAKNYEKRCARLVQEAAKVPYARALHWVREHQIEFPETMPVEIRALGIIDSMSVGQ